MLGLAPADPALENPMAVVFMTVGLIAISVLLTISVRGRIARRNAARPSPRELIDQMKTAGRQAGDVHAATGQLVATAQRLSAQLDNKARHLEILIQQADERITALSAPASGPAPASAPVPAPVPEPAPPPQPVEATAPAVGSWPSPNDRSDRALDPLTRSVYEHSDAGLSPVQIARQLDEQVGKVELILALREAY